MDSVRTSLNRIARQYGVEVLDVRIKRTDLPDGTPLAAAFDRMRTAREQEARSIRAQGAKQAQIIRAQADADAAKTYAASFGKDPRFLRFLSRDAELSDDLRRRRPGQARADQHHSVAAERLSEGIHWTHQRELVRSNGVKDAATLAPLRLTPNDGVSMRSKESGKVRYAYGVAMALLLGGTAFSLATGQAGAQVPQNAPGTSALAPRPGAPMSFADLVAQAAAGGGQHLDQAAHPGQSPVRSVRGILPPVRPDPAAGRHAAAAAAAASGGPAAHPRGRLARLRLHHFAQRLHRHQQPLDPGADRHRHGRHGHRHHLRPQGIYRADRRPRRDLRPRAAEDRRRATCRSSSGATAPRRGSATG